MLAADSSLVSLRLSIDRSPCQTLASRKRETIFPSSQSGDIQVCQLSALVNCCQRALERQSGVAASRPRVRAKDEALELHYFVQKETGVQL